MGYANMKSAYPKEIIRIIYVRLYVLSYIAMTEGIKMMTFNAIERGWFAESGAHSAKLRNTSVGMAGNLGVLRAFLVFDLAALEASMSVGKATLHIELEAFLSPDAQETFVASSVGVPARAATMTYRPGSVTGKTIFEALGSGVEYGRATVTSNDVGRVIEIPLDAQALADMEASAGRWFAIGLHLDDATDDLAERDLHKMIRFSASAEARRHQLVVDAKVASAQANRDGVFGLQYEVADGVVNKSLQDVVKAQAKTLEAMLQSVLEAVVRTEDRHDMEESGKHAYLNDLIQRTSEQLSTFAQNHVRVEQRIGDVLVGSEQPAALSEACVLLLEDLERVNTVLHANLAVARRYLDLMLDQHLAQSDADAEADPFDLDSGDFD